MEWNQSVDCLSAQTVGKGYFEAVTLMWSPSVYVMDGRGSRSVSQHAIKRKWLDGWMDRGVYDE